MSNGSFSSYNVRSPILKPLEESICKGKRPRGLYAASPQVSTRGSSSTFTEATLPMDTGKQLPNFSGATRTRTETVCVARQSSKLSIFTGCQSNQKESITWKNQPQIKGLWSYLTELESKVSKESNCFQVT